MRSEFRRVDDLDPFLELARQAFAIPQREHPSLKTYVEGLVARGTELFGIYRAGKLRSAAMLHPFRMRLREGLVAMGGLGFVCSRLDARGQGATRALLVEALGTMRKRGHTVSVLYPFSLSFYRRYGWELFSQEVRVVLPPGTIAAAEGPGIEAETLPFPDQEAQEFYNAYARAHYTLVQRGEREWWKALFPRSDEAGRGVVKFTCDGRVVGLLSYVLPGQGEKNRLVVPLFIPVDEQAKWGMLVFLTRLSFQIKELELRVPTDFTLWPYLKEAPARASLGNPAMLRIVSLEALEGLPVSAPDVELALQVEDPQAPWNAGAFTLAVEDGRLHVRPGGKPELRLGIGALSAALAGFTTFRELAAWEGAEAKPAWCGQDLPRRVTWLADHF